MSDNEKNLNVQDIMNDSPKYPERAAERRGEQPSCEGVYAGPEQMPVFAQPSNPSAMMTYAGPQFMNGGGMGFPMSAVPSPAPQAPVQPTAQQASPDKVQCSKCGSFIPKGSNFCSECGSPMDTAGGGNKA